MDEEQVRIAADDPEVRGRALQLIDDVTAWLTTGDLLRGLYEVATRLAEGFMFSRCTIFLRHDDDPQTIFIWATSDDSTLNRYPLKLAKYPEVSAAFDTYDPVFIDDVASSQLLGQHASAAAEFGGCSSLAIPLLAEQRAIGALLFRSSERRARPHEDELALLRTVAQVIAAALRGSRLDMLREQTQRTSAVERTRLMRLRSLEQYRDVFESFTDAIVVIENSGALLFINRAAEQLTGYSHSGLAGRSLADVVIDFHPEKLARLVEQLEQGQQQIGLDVRIKTTSGERLLLAASVSKVLFEQGAIVLSLRDVTESRVLEEELRKTKEFLERLIDSTVDGIIAADLQGNVIIFNQGAERIFGYSAEEVIGKLPVWKLYPSEALMREVMMRLRSSEHGPVGRLGPTRYDVVARDGMVVPVSFTASIIYEDGREVASVGIISDLRERMYMEQRLAQAQEKLLASEKQSLIADLAGTTAHELNQPLTSVMGYAELLKKRLASDDSNLHAVEIILREAERMAHIVHKIGRITRYETKAYVGSTTILDLDKSTTDK